MKLKIEGAKSFCAMQAEFLASLWNVFKKNNGVYKYQEYTKLITISMYFDT